LYQRKNKDRMAQTPAANGRFGASPYSVQDKKLENSTALKLLLQRSIKQKI